MSGFKYKNKMTQFSHESLNKNTSLPEAGGEKLAGVDRRLTAKDTGLRVAALKNSPEIQEAEIAVELKQAFERRDKSLRILALDSIRDQQIIQSIQSELYDIALKQHSQQTGVVGKTADTISFYWKKFSNLGEDKRLFQVMERQVFRQALSGIIRDGKASTIEEAIVTLKKLSPAERSKYCATTNPITHEIQTFDLNVGQAEQNWRGAESAISDTYGRIFDVQIVEQNFPAQNIDNLTLAHENFARNAKDYALSKQLLFGVLNPELTAQTTPEEKSRIRKEVELKNVKGELKKQLEFRKAEMRIVLSEELKKAKADLEKNGASPAELAKVDAALQKVDQIISSQIEEKSTNYQEGIIQEQIQKQAFKKIDAKSLADPAKREAHFRLRNNYDFNDKWWIVADETGDKVMREIFVSGALIALSGGLAAGAGGATMRGLGQLTANKTILNVASWTAELAVEGVVFHTSNSVLDTFGRGSEAWNDYLKETAHSIGMFGTIKAGKVVWNSLGRRLLGWRFGTEALKQVENATIRQLSAQGEVLNYLGALATETAAFSTYDISVEELEKIIHKEPLSDQLLNKFLSKSGENLMTILELRIGGKIFGPLMYHTLLASGDKGRVVWEKVKKQIGAIKAKRYEAGVSAPEVEGKWSPRILLTNDFNSDCIFRDKNGPQVNHPDLNRVMDFYADSLRGEKIVNMGAGPTHLHYLASAVARMISRGETNIKSVKPFDISAGHLELLREFLGRIDAELKGNKDISKGKFVEAGDWEVFRTLIAALAKQYQIPEKSILQVLHSVSVDPKTNQLAYIQGDMNKVDKLIGQESLDQINFGFCIFAPDEKSVTNLLEKSKSRLKPGGRISIVDMQGYVAEDAVGHFAEDPLVLKTCPQAIDIKMDIVKKGLQEAGFTDIQVSVYDLRAPGEEKDRGFKYVFATARKPDENSLLSLR